MFNLKKNICLISYLINSTFMFLGFILITCFFGCAKYNPKPLRAPSGIIKQKEDLEVSKKIFSEKDCKSFFDRKLIERGYQPIQLYIKNNSDQVYVLNTKDITLPIEPVNNVALSTHRDVAWKATKYFLIFGPILGALEGFNSYEVNKKIDSDFTYKAMGENDVIEIKPGGIFNKIMFVANENLQTNFNLRLTSLNKKEKVSFEL